MQVQVSVLKEEKRNLLRQVDELSKASQWNESGLHRYRSQSFSEQRGSQRNLRNAATPTRDMGTMCGAMTRDVGVSHQQVRRRLPFHADLSPARSPLFRCTQAGEIVRESELREKFAYRDSRLPFLIGTSDWALLWIYTHNEKVWKTLSSNFKTRSLFS